MRQPAHVARRLGDMQRNGVLAARDNHTDVPLGPGQRRLLREGAQACGHSEAQASAAGESRTSSRPPEAPA
eukprot:CAMPEP_0170389424 /NCGR_PEP_ID=MMETSP0117_2-20130122/18611_1 /TAXON_ID=400756 /ORGANISM="Durinskia baltica, Strain CSIRO CS-38" /LENGTH=70 /DNA_ID=CAMNT_0010645413 /DNA_START=72 /DNA_END=280 /DNA_ORIENTATION=-